MLSEISQIEKDKELYDLSYMKVKVAQLCPTLWDPMGYTVHGILQARILDWVAIPFSRGSSQPRDWSKVSCIVGRFFNSWATREAQEYWSGYPFPSPGDILEPRIEPRSPHCRRILYQFSHKGSLRILEWVAYPFSSGSSWPRNWTGVSALQADSLPTELSGKPQVYRGHFICFSQ